MKKLIFTFVAVIIAGTALFARQTTTLNPTADGFVSSSDDSYVGTNLNMALSSYNTNIREIFLDFDLTSVIFTPQHATLKLYINSVSNANPVILGAYAATGNAIDGSLTFTNRPITGQYHTTDIHTSNAAVDQWISFDFADFIKAQDFSSNKLLYFRIAVIYPATTSTTCPLITIGSIESSNAPQLVLSDMPTPGVYEVPFAEMETLYANNSNNAGKPEFAFNGAGLLPDMKHVTAGDYMMWRNLDGSYPFQLMVKFKEAIDITKLHVWNANWLFGTGSTDYTNRGAKRVDIYVSSSSTDMTTVTDFTDSRWKKVSSDELQFAQATGSTSYEGEDISLTGADNAYWLALNILSNHAPSNYAAISEIKVYKEITEDVQLESVWDPKENSTNWTEDDNWSTGVAPSNTSDIRIPTSSSYPVLETATTVNTITFAPGAEIGGQENLTITGKAVVELDVAADRWHLLSVPVDAVSGDFYFNNTPDSWLRKFNPAGYTAGWKYITGLEEPLPIGTGFAFFVDQAHSFEIEGSSLAGATPITEPLKFLYDEEYASDFTLVGNPFMSTIDFDALYAANGTKIRKNYQVWTDTDGYSGYNPVGNFGVTIPEDLDKYIAPLQSFIVEKDAAEEDDFLVFNIITPGLIATGASSGLRSSQNEGNKLNITAGNEVASVLTFIANREDGQSSRKLKAGINNLPDIYTLDGATALGANIIHTDNILIPIGISTAYAGNITLTIQGMNNYEAAVTFIDNEAETRETGISENDTFEYMFNYQPKKDSNDRVIAEEERFFIQLAPKNLTGLTAAPVQNINVYSKNHSIYAVSGANDLIKQLSVYNIQGMLLYSNDQVNAPHFTTGKQVNLPEICIVKVITEQGVKNVKIITK
ncbi:hypothetical protein FACS189413_12930 [Bacteroidia bacterium]|nr:hypothetical protein FACS189413_12930 [Bacteroidia bacterium]